VLALVVATFVLVRRVVHLYAQHVRVGPLTRTARFRVATAALLPLSFVLVFLNVAALDGVVPLGNTGWVWLRDALATLGFRSWSTWARRRSTRTSWRCWPRR